jgi:hypothetical protein
MGHKPEHLQVTDHTGYLQPYRLNSETDSILVTSEDGSSANIGSRRTTVGTTLTWKRGDSSTVIPFEPGATFEVVSKDGKSQPVRDLDLKLVGKEGGGISSHTENGKSVGA